MSTEFKLPFLGEGIEDAEVVRILVKVGDTIKIEDGVVEAETGKAAIEIPTDVAGTVEEIHIKIGDKIAIGQTIITVSGEAAVATSEPEPAQPTEPTPEPTAATSEEPAAAEPVAQSSAPEPVQPSPAPPTAVMSGAAARTGKAALASPSVRKLAREFGLDINAIPGSAARGRIKADDVKKYSRELNKTRNVVAAGGAIVSQPLPDFSKWGSVSTQPMSSIRRATATHLAAAWQTIPHVTQCDKADITELSALRKQFTKKAEEMGGKLTVTAILLKVVASALKVFPQFNSSIDIANGQIIHKDYVHVGIAVDTENGLLVPVIRDVDKKNILDLSVELGEIAGKARDRKIKLEDMQGGTFTISNLGGIGGTYFTPIINAPEVAILGVSRGSKEQVYINDEFQARMMLPLSLSYDHRVIDGADGARFIRWIVEALEQPFLLSLEG